MHVAQQCDGKFPGRQEIFECIIKNYGWTSESLIWEAEHEERGDECQYKRPASRLPVGAGKSLLNYLITLRIVFVI